MRRWRNGSKKKMLNPFLAAWTLVLAQSCAYTGSVLLGWHAGIFLDQLRLWNLRSDQTSAWQALAMAGGGLVMIVVGLLVERFCRIPPEDGEGDAAPAPRKNASPSRKANMRTEAIDPPGITWQRVSPKYVTVRLAGWALANLIVVRVLCLPLCLSSSAGGSGPAVAGRRHPGRDAGPGPVAARADSPPGAGHRLRRTRG